MSKLVDMIEALQTKMNGAIRSCYESDDCGDVVGTNEVDDWVDDCNTILAAAREQEQQHDADLREARTGMREACVSEVKRLANANRDKISHDEWASLHGMAVVLGTLSDLAADEAIERIKAESYEKGMQAGAKDEALLQYIFDEPGPIKDGIERIKREARLDEARKRPHDSDCKEGQWSPILNDTHDCTCGREQRIAALSGKETT